MEAIYTFCGVGLLVVVGLLVFAAFAFVLRWQSEREERVQSLQSAHLSAGHARSMEKQDLLWRMRGLSEEQCKPLWEEFHRLDKIDKQMSAAERNRIVNAQTVIDEQTQWELTNGINPYPKRTRAAKLRAAKVRR